MSIDNKLIVIQTLHTKIALTSLTPQWTVHKLTHTNTHPQASRHECSGHPHAHKCQHFRLEVQTNEWASKQEHKQKKSPATTCHDPRIIERERDGEMERKTSLLSTVRAYIHGFKIDTTRERRKQKIHIRQTITTVYVWISETISLKWTKVNSS